MIEKNQAIAVSVVAVIAFLGLSVFAADSLFVETRDMSFDMNGTAVDTGDSQTQNIGVVTESNLRFGNLPLNSSSIKFIEVNSTNQALVTVSADGNISEHISYPEKSYFQGSKEVRVEFNATEEGYYTGNLGMKIRTSDNALGQTWLDIRNSVF